MALVIAVHGIAQQLKGGEQLRGQWLPAIVDGVRAAGKTITNDAVGFAFYGGLFRSPDRFRGSGESVLSGNGDEREYDAELLLQLWRSAATIEPDRVSSPDASIRGVGSSTQAALRALTRSKFFIDVAEHALMGDLRQVRRYFHEPNVRLQAQSIIDASVTSETRAIVAHSLGSVVAYEALCRYGHSANWANVTALITLGSPLGIRNLVFDRLQPGPTNGRGHWPATIKTWTNISDDSDVVALEKKLAPIFGSRICDIAVDNGTSYHDIAPYLCCRATGAAIADVLA